jgi:hypothetical protein
MAKTSDPEALALKLLLRQSLRGPFALCFLDYRHLLTDGRTTIDTMSAYETRCGTILPFRPDGLTLRQGSRTLILYNDAIENRRRMNFTLAHELGHVYLNHTEETPHTQEEADRFAAALLMPESVIRFLDCQANRLLTPEEMTTYFGASLTACRRRRAELDRKEPTPPTPDGVELVRRLFGK